MPLLPVEAFWTDVKARRVTFSDGAVGTELIGQGAPLDELMRCNLGDADRVRSIHDAYIAVGAQVITSNTFGLSARADWLAGFEAGATLALNAAARSADNVAVWLSIPAVVLASNNHATRAIARIVTQSPATLLVETCTSLEEARAAARAAAAIPAAVLTITAHFGEGATMLDGTAPEVFVRVMRSEGAHAMGANCGAAPELFTEVAVRMRAATDSPLLFQPSAGLPRVDATGGVYYPSSPMQFAEALRRIADAGANIVGGCCGTSPTHIAAAVTWIRRVHPD